MRALSSLSVNQIPWNMFHCDMCKFLWRIHLYFDSIDQWIAFCSFFSGFVLGSVFLF